MDNNIQIWKFPISVKDVQTVEMPKGSHILCVQVQPGTGPCIWALCKTDEPNVPRTIVTFRTGEPVDIGKGIYLGTYQQAGGNLVFHVFEKTELLIEHFKRPFKEASCDICRETD